MSYKLYLYLKSRTLYCYFKIYFKFLLHNGLKKKQQYMHSRFKYIEKWHTRRGCLPIDRDVPDMSISFLQWGISVLYNQLMQVFINYAGMKYFIFERWQFHNNIKARTIFVSLFSLMVFGAANRYCLNVIQKYIKMK